MSNRHDAQSRSGSALTENDQPPEMAQEPQERFLAAVFMGN